MNINKRYKHGELAPDVGKVKNAKLEIDPNMKIKQGDFSSAADKPGKKRKS